MSLLFSRRFGAFFTVQFLSAFNDSALKNALVLMIAYGAARSAALSAQLLIPLAGGLFILPFLLCSAGAGQIADESDKARLTRLIKLFEIPLMAAAAGGVLAGSTVLLLVLLTVMGVEAAFLGPIKYAILPELLLPEELVLGNALIEAGTFLAILFGTIAGMLVALRHGAVLVGSMMIAVGLLAWAASLFVPPTGAAARRGPPPWNLVAATARILCETVHESRPFRAMLAISWFWLAGATYLSQFPAYVRFTLRASQPVVTLFLVVFSVGIALGSLLCSRLLRRRAMAPVAWGALGIGLFSIDLWLASPAPSAPHLLVGLGAFLAAPRSWRILGDLLAISLSGGVFILPLYVLLQRETARARRARAIAANNVVNAAAMVLSAALTIALLAAGVTVAGLFLVTGVATLAVAGLCWRGFSRG